MEIAHRGSGLASRVCHRGDDGEHDGSMDDLPGVEGDGHWDIADDGADWVEIGSEESRCCIDEKDNESEGEEDSDDDGGVRVGVRVRLRRWTGRGKGKGDHAPRQEGFTAASKPSNNDDDWEELISRIEGTPKRSESPGSRNDQRGTYPSQHGAVEDLIRMTEGVKEWTICERT